MSFSLSFALFYGLCNPHDPRSLLEHIVVKVTLDNIAFDTNADVNIRDVA
jgi:hypothetical protein